MLENKDTPEGVGQPRRFKVRFYDWMYLLKAAIEKAKEL